MFGEYAQVASFYDETGKDYYETDDSSYLPSYLLPKPRFISPWPKPHSITGENFAEDEFILVAEFSELEGPKPLITIPTDGGQNFDKNSFSVKILSVDHQSTHRGFKIPEDNQIYISDEEERAFSFVHHFVLLDHEARGYVRPFCMAYVSYDSRKVLENYESFTEQFQKAADYFKYGNRLIFKRDCEQKLEDLQCTKDYLINMERLQLQNGSTLDQEDYSGDRDIHTSLKTIEALQNDFQVMLEKVGQLLNDRKMEERFQRMEGGRKADDKRLKGKSETDSCSLQDIDYPEKEVSKCGSFSEVYSRNNLMFWNPQEYKPTVLNLTQAKKFERTLRGLHELCFWGAKEALKFLRCMQEYYSKDRETQEMQIFESSLINPLSSVLTFGNCAVSNFMSGINMCQDDDSFSNLKSYKPCRKFINNVLFRWPSTESFKSVQSFISIQDEECSLSSAKSSYGQPFAFDELYKRGENGIKDSRKESEQFFSQCSKASINSMGAKIPDSPKGENNKLNTHENEKTSRDSPVKSISEYVHINDSKPDERTNGRSESTQNDLLYHRQHSDVSDKEESSVSSPSKDSSASHPGFSSGKSSGWTDTFYSLGSMPMSREDSMDRISDIKSESFHSVDSSSADELIDEIENMKENTSVPVKDIRPSSLVLPTDNKFLKHNFCDVSSHKSSSEPESTSCPDDVTDGSHRTDTCNSVCSKCNQNTFHTNIEDSDVIFNRGGNCSSNLRDSLRTEDCSHSVKSDIAREKSPTSKLTQSLQAQNGISVQSTGTPKHCLTNVDTQYSINNDDTDEENLPVPSAGLSRIPLQRNGRENNEEITRNKKELVINNVTNYMFQDKPLPGDGMYKVMTSYNNIHHIIHSLLCGRPVIVLGSTKHEEDIKTMINALWIFIPGYNSRPIILHNANKMLKITDICGNPLLGIIRADKVQAEKILPHMMKRYVSVLDIEKRQIIAPHYKGTLLNPLMYKKKNIKNDDVFCLRIQCFLSDLSSKAFVFFHTICLGSAGGLNNTGVLLKDSKAYRETVRLFLSKQLNVTDLMDQSIIQHLAEVVKQNQIQYLEEIKDYKYHKKENRLRTDHQQCQTFKC